MQSKKERIENWLEKKCFKNNGGNFPNSLEYLYLQVQEAQ